jgi:MFS family permease
MEISPNTVPQVYPQRWTQLIYLSLLALLSDWICFSVAAAPETYEAAYGNVHSAASLIDLFLFTNVASCFVVTDVVDKIGLQRAIQAAAVLMTIGCWLRSGIGVTEMVPYEFIVAGTVLVGIAQPFFQCTPPLLSATWFAASERATATAVALNFNQIGIATAFLVGGGMAGHDMAGLAQYFILISAICTVVATGTLFQFENEPPVPPSKSELEKKLRNEKEPPFLTSVQRLLTTRGFTMPLAAFVCSISLTNVVGTFIDDILERGGITNQLHIDLAGAAFELAILLGGIVIGGYVDKTKDYKRTTLACLAVAAISVLPLGWTDHAMGPTPVIVTAALLALGLSAGPIQPINAELAVDVTYPSDETAVESVQQIFGNMVSALLIPVAEYASRTDWQLFASIPALAGDLRGDVVLLCGVAVATLFYFNTFDAPLARTSADTVGDNENNNEGGKSTSAATTTTLAAPPKARRKSLSFALSSWFTKQS